MDPSAELDELRATVRRTWDRAASGYDRTPRHGLLHDDERRAWQRLLAAALGDPRHAAVPALRVLDVGTGTGVLALLAAGLGHDVTGLDLSEGMLTVARRKAIDTGLSVRWLTGDAEDPPLPAATFDVVMSRHLAWTLPRPELALAAWRRLLVPGGLVVLLDGIQPRRPVVVRAGQSFAGRLDRAVARWQAGTDDDHEYPAATYRRLPLAGQSGTEAVVRLLAEAGYVAVRVRRVTEVERAERRHLPLLRRLADPWRAYLATARAPQLRG